MHKHLRERPEHVGSLIEIKLCKTHLWSATCEDKIEGLSSNLELVEWGLKKIGDKLSGLRGYVVQMVEDFCCHLEGHCITWFLNITCLSGS